MNFSEYLIEATKKKKKAVMDPELKSVLMQIKTQLKSKKMTIKNYNKVDLVAFPDVGRDGFGLLIKDGKVFSYGKKSGSKFFYYKIPRDWKSLNDINIAKYEKLSTVPDQLNVKVKAGKLSFSPAITKLLTIPLVASASIDDDDLSQYGIKELFGALTLDLIKSSYKWLLSAKYKDLVVGLEGSPRLPIDMHELIVREGTWLKGTFRGDQFHGTWKNGTMAKGWFKGEWENGTFTAQEFLSGSLWKNGTWNRGTFGQGCVWENGTFNAGNCKGTFLNGVIEAQGAMHGGGIFKGGVFKGDRFIGSTFEGGTFDSKKGTFENSQWIDGNWEAGKWISGTNVNGELKTTSPDTW